MPKSTFLSARRYKALPKQATALFYLKRGLRDFLQNNLENSFKLCLIENYYDPCFRGYLYFPPFLLAFELASVARPAQSVSTESPGDRSTICLKKR